MFLSHDSGRTDLLAHKIIQLCQEDLITVMPYMDRVLLNTPIVFHDPEKDAMAEIQFGTDGREIHTFSYMVIETYMNSMEQMNRILFHSLLHCLFCHMYECRNLDEKIWNLSTDIAVESVILNLNYSVLEIPGDDRRKDLLSDLFPRHQYRNAESLYNLFLSHPHIRQKAFESAWLFQQDRHDLWYNAQNAEIRNTEKQNQWKNRRKAVEQEVQDYESARGLAPGSLTRKLHLQKVKSEDYSELLRRFLENEEEIRTDPDSFDAILYTFGLQKYHNMPLIEPLEYQETDQIREFVIAIDTSASCKGKKVISFLQKTRSVLSGEAFSSQMNVHIIQCDAKIQSEVRISSLGEYDAYLDHLILKGFGGTDFRPVFERVNEEMHDGTFHHLRGLIYFTDGNGVFPAEAPAYQTAFVIDSSLPQEQLLIPSWAVRIFLNGETE